VAQVMLGRSNGDVAEAVRTYFAAPGEEAILDQQVPPVPHRLRMAWPLQPANLLGAPMAGVVCQGGTGGRGPRHTGVHCAAPVYLLSTGIRVPPGVLMAQCIPRNKNCDLYHIPQQSSQYTRCYVNFETVVALAARGTRDSKAGAGGGGELRHDSAP
jgi:hypothetical protein